MLFPTVILAALFCSGASTTYDLEVEVDGQAGTILVDAIDSDATYPGFVQTYQGLTWKDGCLQSPEIKFCPSRTGMGSTIEMKLPQPDGSLFLEEGWVDCRP